MESHDNSKVYWSMYSRIDTFSSGCAPCFVHTLILNQKPYITIRKKISSKEMQSRKFSSCKGIYDDEK